MKLRWWEKVLLWNPCNWNGKRIFVSSSSEQPAPPYGSVATAALALDDAFKYVSKSGDDEVHVLSAHISSHEPIICPDNSQRMLRDYRETNRG